jgi:hypothetical protein
MNMPNRFSVVSWNIKNFTRGTAKEDRVVDHLKSMNPDVFGLLEVVGKDAWRCFYQEFPNHDMFITEGEQSQEILIGVHKDFRCFFTQRDEFKAGRTHLRPGPFVALQPKNSQEYYVLLFLHLKSMRDPEGFGLRDDMLSHAFNLKKAVDAMDKEMGGTGESKFGVMGDLNNMGMQYWRQHKFEASVEIEKLEGKAELRKMSLLPKDYQWTWTDGNKESDLDHVVAADSIKFTSWNGNRVRVEGWNKVQDVSKWIKDVSDHCALYCEIEY